MLLNVYRYNNYANIIKVTEITVKIKDKFIFILNKCLIL